MYELKKIGKVFTSKFVGTGPSSFEKRIYRAAVSQRLRNTGIWGTHFVTTYTRAPSLVTAVCQMNPIPSFLFVNTFSISSSISVRNQVSYP